MNNHLSFMQLIAVQQMLASIEDVIVKFESLSPELRMAVHDAVWPKEPRFLIVMESAIAVLVKQLEDGE